MLVSEYNYISIFCSKAIGQVRNTEPVIMNALYGIADVHDTD